LGGVGVQIARIYITSTGAGCTSLCILNTSSSTPTSTSSAFQQSTQFLNAGEVNHAVLLYLPGSVSLPDAYPPPNTVFIVTSRGNVFSFQWPFPFQMGGQSQSAFSAGIVKVAYQMNPCSGCSGGFDSKNEPGLGGSGTSSSGYCHSEPSEAYPAGAGYAEKLTVNYPGVQDSNVLWFVNPWVTNPILETAEGTNGTSSTNSKTTLYIYVNITNTGTVPYTVAGGSLDLTWYGSNHITGSLIGIYYNNTLGTLGPMFYPIGTTQTVATTKSFQAIFRVTLLALDTGVDWPPANDVMFWGSASLTDNMEGQTFVGGVALLSGLWIPLSCSG
jgi:hypothetical protein